MRHVLTNAELAAIHDTGIGLVFNDFTGSRCRPSLYLAPVAAPVASGPSPNADFHAAGSAQRSGEFVADYPVVKPGYAGACGKAGFAQDG
jgi:hypothetical protein